MAENFVAKPVVWVGVDDLRVEMANQFLGQVDGDQVVFTIGQVAPPVILGETQDERRAQADRIPYVPITPLGRFSMTQRRMQELIQVLQTTLENMERIAEEDNQ